MLQIEEKHQFKYFQISELSNLENTLNNRIGKLIQYIKKDDVYVFRMPDNKLRRYENVFIDELPKQMTNLLERIYNGCSQDEYLKDEPIDGKIGFIV